MGSVRIKWRDTNGDAGERVVAPCDILQIVQDMHDSGIVHYIEVTHTERKA